ncbi:MAG: carbohydrate ABC transporter permease [Clostridia bacterium]|nr:carbohydrate ABC transporter permease [Clostridia bacterium]
MDSTKPRITKETKDRISVDYEGKLSFKERFLYKIKSSFTWIKILINILRFILMLGVSFVILYPFVSRVANSFMSYTDIIDSTVSLIPKNPTLDIYKYIIFDAHYLDALRNTVLLSLLCAIIQTFISCLVGYGLAKFKFKGNALVMIMVVITMAIPHTALKFSLSTHFNHFDLGTIMALDYPGIIELINGSSINLSNTFWPIIILSISGLAFKNGLYIYLMRQFFKGVPDELEESAYVDGSGTFRTFIQIILPLAVPMMITVFLFSFSWQWTDEFYTTLFFRGTVNKVYLMPDVYQVYEGWIVPAVGSSLYKTVVRNTAGMLIIAPLIIMYLFCQRYLVQGIERSGLVG